MRKKTPPDAAKVAAYVAARAVTTAASQMPMVMIPATAARPLPNHERIPALHHMAVARCQCAPLHIVGAGGQGREHDRDRACGCRIRVDGERYRVARRV